MNKVSRRKGTVRIWVDNDNVVRGLEKRLGIERADAVWAVAENWAADSVELEPSWKFQLGVGSDGDLWRPVGSNGSAAGEDGRQAGGSLGEGPRRQEDVQEDDAQASERECQG